MSMTKSISIDRILKIKTDAGQHGDDQTVRDCLLVINGLDADGDAMVRLVRSFGADE
jgi:hypothetical protein